MDNASYGWSRLEAGSPLSSSSISFGMTPMRLVSTPSIGNLSSYIIVQGPPHAD
jgi:hypothetical protein